MNTLIITTAYVVGAKDGNFYHNTLNDHLQRYRIFGNITVCAQIRENYDYGARLNMDGIKIRKIEKVNSVSSLLKYDRRNKQVIADEVRKADLIICYVPFYLTSYAARLAKKLNKKLLTFAVACGWSSYWNHSLKGKLVAPFIFKKMRETVAQADFSMYITQNFLQSRYPSKAPSVGVSDVVLFDFDDDAAEERIRKISSSTYDYSTTPFNIATCAAVNVKYKGQQDVIKAIAQLKDINLHYYLLGSGDQTRLKKLAENLGVAERIHFTGAVPHNEVFKILNSMDLYIQPSRAEALGRAVIEAMSLPLPAIVSNADGIPELVSEEFIFRKKNVSEIKSLILKMLNPEVRAKSARENYEKSKEFETNALNRKRNEFFAKAKADIEASNL